MYQAPTWKKELQRRLRLLRNRLESRKHTGEIRPRDEQRDPKQKKAD